MEMKLEVVVLPVSDVNRVFHHAGGTDRVAGPQPARLSYSSFAAFGDPDGNGWVLQEITDRLPGR